MRIGYHLVSFDFRDGPASIGPTLVEVGAAMEDVGFDNLSLMDHYFQIGYLGPPEDPMLEGYTTLGFVAAHTSTIELQLMVTGVTYRHPGLLAKIVATLDVLSGGRAALGLGTAWYEDEHAGLGVPFAPQRERFERVLETLQIVRQMWSDDDGPYDGRHYRLARTLCSPQPLHRVPIMVGGAGEQKTLRYVAEYGDACNLFSRAGIEQVAHKLDVLRRHCADVGRDPDEIRKTMLWHGEADSATLLEGVKPFADVGIDEVHVMHLGASPVEFVRSFEQVVPALHAV